MYQTSPSLSHNPGSIGILLEFSVRGHERSVHRSQNSHNYSYNHDGLYIVHPSFLQEYIPRGVRGENIQTAINTVSYIRIKNIRIFIFIQECHHTIVQALHHTIIRTFHHTLIQACHHTIFVCLYIALLLLFMNLMQFHTILRYHP